MGGYTKLFGSIVFSTIWREELHVKVVWVTLLALADQWGEVMASVPGLADASRVSIEQCQEALLKLMSPDPYSRTPDFKGRRVEAIDGGWRILNYGKYRDETSKEYTHRKAAERQKRHRDKKRKPVLDALCERDGKRCGICGKELEVSECQIDHIQPLACGGGDDLSNLQMAHAYCNASKRDGYGGRRHFRHPSMPPLERDNNAHANDFKRDNHPKAEAKADSTYHGEKVREENLGEGQVHPDWDADPFGDAGAA